ncbi:MAG: FHA domain-containing protein [Planctomycetota bacterium]|nr:FHA domain-containing protein [Planctomycetota bacterium]
MYLIVGHAEQPEAHLIGREPITIGRSLDNILSLADDLLSRNHCTIHMNQTGDIEFNDLESRNGSRINGEVVQSAILKSGDAIKLGMTTLLIVESSIHNLTMSSETMSWGDEGPPMRVSSEKLRDLGLTLFQREYGRGLNPREQLPYILKQLCEACCFERAMLIDLKNNKSVYKLGFGLAGDELEDDDRGFYQLILDEVLVRGDDVHVVGEGRSGYGYQLVMDDLKVQSALCLPIHRFSDAFTEAKTVVGFLYFDSRIGNPILNPEDSEILGAFTKYIGRIVE